MKYEYKMVRLYFVLLIQKQFHTLKINNTIVLIIICLHFLLLVINYYVLLNIILNHHKYEKF